MRRRPSDPAGRVAVAPLARLAGLVGCAGVLAVCLSWALGGPVGAHALLAASSPADGSSVERAPSEVLLTFTEAPDPGLTAIRVLDATGARVDTGRTEAVAGQPTKVRVPLGEIARGTYTVTWRTTSTSDGHTTIGSVAFGVGVAAPEPAGGQARATGARPPSPAAIAGRWLFYVGVMLLLGAGVVGVAVVARPATMSVWALNGAWAAAAVGLALTISDQRITARASLADLLDSSTGHKLAAQALLVGLTWVAVCWASLRPRRASLAAVGAGAAATMFARALSGHADASSVPWFTVPVQWAHLVAVGAWVGGLVWLLIALRCGDPGRGRGLARRFSAIALVMVGLVAVSGTLRAVAEVGAWGRLLHTSFGRTLLVKVGLFGVLVALGALSRFRYVAAAATARGVRGDAGGQGDGGGLGGLGRTVRAEVLVGAVVLGATAVLAGLPPSTSVAAASKFQRATAVTIDASDYATSVRVRLVVSPGAAGANRFDATVVDYDTRKPVAADALALRLQHRDRPDIAPATIDLTRDPDSHWRAAGTALSVEGRWSVTAAVQTGSDTIEVPMELTAARPGR